MPSELTEAIVELCQVLPGHTADELKRLLAYDLAEPGISFSLPGARIGLLAQVVTRKQGEIPSVLDYERTRKEQTQEWPSGTTLSKEYGGWIRAVSAAVSLTDGSRRSSRPTRGVQVKGQPYDQQQIIAALLRFHSDLGDWPIGPGEYSRWARLARAAETRWGSGDKRIPGLNAFPTCFGSFEAAVAAAKGIRA